MRKKCAMLAVTTVLAFSLAACAAQSQGGSNGSAEGAGTDWDAVVAENPDDPFVKSYEEGTTDIMTMHKGLGYSCVDCHDGEVASLVGTMDEVPDSAGSSEGTREDCLSCHNWDKIKDSVVLDGDKTIYNPEGKYIAHDNHRGLENCSECHSAHETSTLHCVECHYMELPDGWDGFE